MSQNPLRILSILTIAFALQSYQHANANDPAEFHGTLTDLKAAASLLGDAWVERPGLIVENFATIPADPQRPADKIAASMAPAMRAAGVTAAADYTYMTKNQDPTPDVVTVRVLVFRDVKAAREFWDKKYKLQQPGQALYRLVDGFGDRAVDSTEVTKRIVLAGNVIVTCSQLKGMNDYREVLEHYLRKIDEVRRQPK